MTTIVVPTDFSEVSRQALPFAADLASKLAASIELVHVLPALAYLIGTKASRFSGYEDAVAEQAEVEMEALARCEQLEGIPVRTRVSRNGPAAPAIIDVIEETNALLCVISNHGRRGASRVLLGSVTEELLRTTKVPVMTIGDDATLWQPGQQLLVPVDFSAGSLHAVDVACHLAKILQLELHLLHVLEVGQATWLTAEDPSPPPSEVLEERATGALRQLASDVGCRTSTQVVTGPDSVRATILDIADALSPGLIAVGSHGRRGLGRAVLGSVAEGVVRTSSWPTIVVKSDHGLEQWREQAAAS